LDRSCRWDKQRINGGAFGLGERLGQEDHRPVWVVPMELIGQKPPIDKPGKAYLRYKPINLSALLTK
jgi:hypothetical protein